MTIILNKFFFELKSFCKMVNLTFIEQNATKKIVGQTNEEKIEYLKKLTHLYMHNNFISKIGDLSVCKNLQVLYLHNNNITEIQNLDCLKLLKHLYLQNNKIKRISGLENLTNLRKLYLGGNKISVIENLENLPNLNELHIEKQELDGENLCFDPRTLQHLSCSLFILNISNNNLTSIKPLEILHLLKFLKASGNKIIDFKETAEVLSSMYYIAEVDFTGNPMTKKHRYRETIIAKTSRLYVLDNKDIKDTTRDFIKRFEHEKNNCKMSTAEVLEPSELVGDVPWPIKKEVSKTVVNKLQRNLSSSLLLQPMSDTAPPYVPWQALPKSVTTLNQRSTVQPILRKNPEESKEVVKKVHFKTVMPTFF